MTTIHLLERHTLTVNMPYGKVVEAITKAQSCGSTTMLGFSGDGSQPCAINAAHVVMVTP